MCYEWGIKMKKRLILLGIMFFVTGISVLITRQMEGTSMQNKDSIQVVTSFYPMYIAALNLTDNVEQIELSNLTENKGGCLHDYQLTTKDMKKLEHADVLILNGGGMESFIDSVLEAYPDIKIINASEEVDLLENEEGHEHEHEEVHSIEEDIHSEEEHEGHNHGEWNGHVWMDPVRYEKQIQKISKELQKIDKAHAKQYVENEKKYRTKIQKLEKELTTLEQKKLNENIIIFHDAFAYLANRLGMNIVHQIDMDNDTSFSAGEVAEIIDEMRENKVSILLAEKQFSMAIPESIAKENKAKVVVIDSLVSGAMDKDAYIDGMEENIRIMKQELTK